MTTAKMQAENRKAYILQLVKSGLRDSEVARRAGVSVKYVQHVRCAKGVAHNFRVGVAGKDYVRQLVDLL